MNYKPLKESFSRKGFTFTLLKREGDKAIYEQKMGSKLLAYEVIKVRRHDGYTIAGVFMEPSETYPSDSDWGTYGWTYTKLEQAKTKYDSLNE